MNPRIVPFKLSPAIYTIISMRLPCGFPSPAADYIQDAIDLNKVLINNAPATFFFNTQGDSMAPMIEDGDLLVIDKSLTAKPGSIVLAVIDGEFTVKQYTTEKLRPVLVPLNKKYPPVVIGEFTDARVWGVVTNVIKNVTV